LIGKIDATVRTYCVSDSAGVDAVLSEVNVC